MADVTIVEPIAAPIEVVQTHIPIETLQEVSEAAIQVAEIEANRDVQIAEIRADTEQQAIEAASTQIEEEDNEWRRNIETRLEQQETTNREILSTLQALREMQPQNQPEKSESPEAMPESREAPEPAPKPKAQHHRLI